jgi:hypothetical protein
MAHVQELSIVSLASTVSLVYVAITKSLESLVYISSNAAESDLVSLTTLKAIQVFVSATLASSQAIKLGKESTIRLEAI